MRILLCNERLLFRFGVDRVLLLLAEGLRNRGHHITLMANHLDSEVVEMAADRVLEASAGEVTYLDLDDFTAAWLAESWDALFTGGTDPELALVGGWPFFGSIPVFRDHGVATVFLDCGAVPLDGYEGHALAVQSKVRELRRDYLSRATAILAISKFIADTQSRRDAPELGLVQPILLGANHLGAALWRAEDLYLRREGEDDPVAKVRRAQESGHKIILNLGRWEPGIYKRSEVIFDIARDLRDRQAPRFVFAILDEPQSVDVPADLDDRILPIGYPDDAELAEIIKLLDVGVSVSSWEGFNLPVAELQWFGKPALALNVAAHPEVACDPWCLAPDDAALTDKLEELLTSGHPEPEFFQRSVEDFRNQFAWDKVQARYVEALEAIAQVHRPVLVVDVSQACCDTANSGVMRVTRRLCRHLQRYCDVVFGVWDQDIEAYGFPYEPEYARISSFNGPETKALPHSPWGRRIELMGALAEQGRRPDWVVTPELVREPRGRKIRDSARLMGVRVAGIFYDAIPVLHPELVADSEVRENHADYMKGLAECDAVMPISDFSRQCLEEFWAAEGVAPTASRTVLLPDEFGGAPRRAEPKRLVPGDPVEILCVSTLEPRKNHLALLTATRCLDELAPGIDWRLTLVGNHYSGAETIRLAVEAAAHADPRIRWLGVVDDEELHRLYADSTLTVYASRIEGYGMPVVESLWYATPVLCHDGGVMREVASEGGCLVADLSSPEVFARSLARLATSASLYNELSVQAAQRPTRSWDRYACDILHFLSSGYDRREESLLPMASEVWRNRSFPSPSSRTVRAKALDDTLQAGNGGPSKRESRCAREEILFPGCLTHGWQMEDSERLALMAVLHRHRPAVALEIGTYKGGSLSLIAHYAEKVYSVDIDPSVPERLPPFDNVEFLTGASSVVLPDLLRKLAHSDVSVDFVLIDGEAAESVRQDIELVIGYRPLAPMIVMIHDSFNPECRRGILAARWAASPYVQWVDVDLVPGRVIERDGFSKGELWGGLACAFVTPWKRAGPLSVDTSASEMFTMMTIQLLGGELT